MELADRKRRLLNRYMWLIALLGIMLYLHSFIIQIHPLIFLVWPLSFWLMIEVLVRFKEKRFMVLVFSATFIAYILVTQLLVVEKPQGIFFNLEPVHNMSTISYLVLAEASLFFLYHALTTRSVSFRDVPAYIGFASVIPWLSPAVVEAIILMRWSLNGTFSAMTAGKGIGGASLNDILFYYGGRNFVISSALFYVGALVLYISQRIIQQHDENRFKRLMAARDEEWIIHVWENPLTLLGEKEQETFLNDYKHLAREDQNKVLRKEILPAKGILLIDPNSLS